MKQTNRKSIPNIKPTTLMWEKQFNSIIDAHFKEAESRIPLFIQKELKSVGRVFLRNFKYTAIDFILLVYNIVGQIINLIIRKKVFTQKESLTETAIRRSFDELVFHSEELDRKIRRFFHKLDRHLFEAIQAQIEQEQHKKFDAKTYKSLLNQAIKQTTTFPDITKLILVESAVPIFCSYYFAHRFTKGFGPVGMVMAQSYYKNHYLNWFERWFLLPLNLKKIPFYVPMLGSIAGFTVGLVVAAPFLNAIIEIIFSHFSNPQKRIARQLNQSKKQLLFGDKKKGRLGAIGLIFERMNMMGEVLDYIKDVVLMLR